MRHRASTFEAANLTMLQFGEGLGVRLASRHRLVACCWYDLTHAAHGNGSFGFEGAVCIVSDDQGTSWRVAGRVPTTTRVAPNEVGLAVLSNGSVLMNMRDALQSHRRWQARLDDGALSFTAA
eukprot:6036259-Prymnesium_polylepis.2